MWTNDSHGERCEYCRFLSRFVNGEDLLRRRAFSRSVRIATFAILHYYARQMLIIPLRTDAQVALQLSTSVYDILIYFMREEWRFDGLAPFVSLSFAFSLRFQKFISRALNALKSLGIEVFFSYHPDARCLEFSKRNALISISRKHVACR
jgi:hypothetical protein